MNLTAGNDFSMLNRMYRKALLPNIFIILGGTVNVFFDGILVGQRIGQLGVAAVNQSLAVYLILCTTGSLISAGAMAEASRALGKNDRDLASGLFSIAAELSVIIGMFFAVIGIFVSQPLASLLGSSETIDMVADYVRITLIGGMFKILVYIPGFFLRLEGKYKSATFLTLIMMISNILLDYIFMFLWDYGIKGAAWASVLSSALACAVGFYLQLRRGMFRLRLTGIKGRELAAIVISGSPMASNNLLSAVRLLVLNAIMSAAGGSQYLVAFAISNNLNEFSICIQNGVPQTGSTMLGLLYGEKDSASMRYLFQSQVKYGTVYSVGLAVILCALSGVIGRLFGCRDNIVVPVICTAISVIPATFNSGMIYYYYAAERVVMANIINILRVLIMPCALALLFYKINILIWIFFPVGELLTIAIWALICKISAPARPDCSAYLFLENVDPDKELMITAECDNVMICSASEHISEFAGEHGFNARQCSTLGLAVEELLVIISEKSLGRQGNINVRLVMTEDGGILRIRSDGNPYNPLDIMDIDQNMEYMGVRMICKMARKVDYQSTLGVNTLLVVI